MNERFCLEESSFQLVAENPEELPAVIQRFLDLVERIRDDDQQITCCAELYDVEVLEGTKMWEIMYVPSLNLLEDDLRRLLGQALDRCTRWENEYEARGERLNIADDPVASKSIEFVFHQVLRGHGISCLCPPDNARYGGPSPITGESGEATIHFVNREENLLQFYRSIIELEDFGEHAYIAHSGLAFPHLYFVPGIETQFRRFDEAYQSIRPKVTHHLSCLNDHFQALFQAHDFQPDPVCREFAASWSISMSKESPRTRRNSEAMRARRVDVEGVPLSCEWHTKISPDMDRIHFHPGNEQIAQGRIVIGIFADHLPT